MLKHKHTNRKSDSPLLLSGLLSLGVLLSTAADASDSFFKNPTFSDLQDGEVTIAGLGHRGAGLHMSVQSSSEWRQGGNTGPQAARQSAAKPEVFLSVRLPW